MTSRFVLEGSELTPQADVSLVGGKAAGLAALASYAAAPVPAFVVVTTTAYAEFMADPAAVAALEALDERLRAGVDPYSVRALATDVTAALAPLSAPPNIAAEIARMAEGLVASGDVAVRSSATGEDTASDSAAGMHHTSLYVAGIAGVIAAVETCWRSLWSAQALQYRLARGLDSPLMAVVIQTQIDPAAAGVVFTTDPIDSSRGGVLEAVAGIGETLVSGHATPETWSQTRSEVAVRGRGGDTVLTDAQAIEVFTRAKVVADNAERAMDVEWAIDQSRQMWFLQARPSTAGLADPKPAPRGRWTRAGFGEWFQRPLSPLFSSALVPRFEAHTSRLLATELKVTRFQPTFAIVNGHFYSRVGVRLRPSLLLAPVRFVRLLGRGVESWDNASARHRAELRRAAAEPDPWSRLDQLTEANAEAWAWILLTGAFAKTAVAQFEAVHRLIVRNGPPAADFLAGHNNSSIAADDALWMAAATIRHRKPERSTWTQSDLAAPAIAAVIDDWIATYGHRALDLDPVYGSPALQREQAVSLILTHLNYPTRRPTDLLSDGAGRRQAALSFSDTRFARSGIRGRVLAASLRHAEAWSHVRESRPNALHEGWPPLRQAIDQLGAALAADGVIARPDDIYFLMRDELHGFRHGTGRGVDLAATVATRRREWLAAAFWSPPVELNQSRVEAALTTRKPRGMNTAVKLEGRAASGGRVAGRARVVADPSQWRSVTPGDVVVTKFNDTCLDRAIGDRWRPCDRTGWRTIARCHHRQGVPYSRGRRRGRGTRDHRD